jgi:hypothetical protein
MDRKRASIPCSNSLDTSKSERGAGLPLGGNNSSFGNISASSHLSAPPGFSVQSNLNQQSVGAHPYHVGNGSGYQNFYGFDKPSQQYGEYHGLPSAFGYYPFYPDHSTGLPPMNMSQPNEFSNRSRLVANGQADHSNGYSLDKELHMLLNQNSSSPVHFNNGNNNIPSARKVEERSNNNNGNGVIKPIIDNIVGSMGMWNGTYTHFGPAEPSTPQFRSESPQNYLRPEPRKADVAYGMATMDNYLPTSASFGTGKESPSPASSNVGTNGRAGTPNSGNETSSRPHTPGVNKQTDFKVRYR